MAQFERVLQTLNYQPCNEPAVLTSIGAVREPRTDARGLDHAPWVLDQASRSAAIRGV